MESNKFFWFKSPYGKPTVISVFVHIAVISLVVGVSSLYWGEAAMPEPENLEVDIVEAKVLDIGNMTTMMTATGATAEEKKSIETMTNEAYSAASEEKQISAVAEVSSESMADETSSAAVVTQLVAVSSGGTGNNGMTGNVGVADGGGTNANGEGAAGGGDSSAGCLYAPKPNYPQSAKKDGVEGLVVVRILIDDGGNAQAVSVQESSGHTVLDAAACQGVKKWRFSPAKKNGVPIASFHSVRVRFMLNDA